jgi:hypothetical protein
VAGTDGRAARQRLERYRRNPFVLLSACGLGRHRWPSPTHKATSGTLLCAAGLEVQRTVGSVDGQLRGRSLTLMVWFVEWSD